MKKIILKNCRVLTMKDDKNEILENVDILIKNDTIYDIGIGITDKEAEKYNMKGKLVMPGLINCHTHLAMSIFRETLEGYTLQEWLENKIWPAEKNLNKEDIYTATLASCIEMIKSGTTTCNDMYFNTIAVCHAIKDSKLRCVSSHHLMDIDNKGEENIKGQLDTIKKFKNNKNINFAIGLHGFYTSSPKYVKEVKKLNKELNLPIHMHFCENKKEVETIKEMHKVESPVELLNKYFSKDKLILAHCVELTKKEIEEISKLKDVSVVYNPVSNMKLGCGFANINYMQKNNINICLGTDGQGSGSNLDLFDVMKITALINKGVDKDPKKLTAKDVLKMATINGAKALGIEDKVGSLEIGKKADIIALDLEDIFTKPENNIYSQIVYNANSKNVYMTIINGEIVYIKNKYLVLKDEKEIINKNNEIIKRIMR